jgi:hypothetical protein
VSYQAGLGRVTLLLIAIGSAGRAAIAQRRVVGYVPLKASELPMLARRLVGHDVEVFAEFFTATPLNSPRQGIAGSFSAGEHGSGTQLGDVVFDTTAQEALQWIVRNECSRTCSKVFVRGRIVRRPFAQTPVLEMAEISYESKIGVRPADSSDLAGKIAALERQVQPSHSCRPTRFCRSRAAASRCNPRLLLKTQPPTQPSTSHDLALARATRCGRAW